MSRDQGALFAWLNGLVNQIAMVVDQESSGGNQDVDYAEGDRDYANVYENKWQAKVRIREGGRGVRVILSFSDTNVSYGGQRVMDFGDRYSIREVAVATVALARTVLEPEESSEELAKLIEAGLCYPESGQERQVQAWCWGTKSGDKENSEWLYHSRATVSEAARCFRDGPKPGYVGGMPKGGGDGWRLRLDVCDHRNLSFAGPMMTTDEFMVWYMRVL